MQVTLLNKNTITQSLYFSVLAARNCYDSFDIMKSTETSIAENDWKLLKQLAKSGHHTVLENVVLYWQIEDVSRACYDKETEILTKDGWKYFKDVELKEEVLTFNPDTEVAEFSPVLEKIEYQYKGNMHKYYSTSTDILVTENHNMMYKKYDVRVPFKKWELIPSNEIKVNKISFNKVVNYKNSCNELFYIKGYEYSRKNNMGNEYIKHTKDLEFNKEFFYPFLAWYLSDGSVYYDKKENKYSISISQKATEDNIKNGTISRIQFLISSLGFKNCYDGKAIKFCSPTLGKYLKNLGLCDSKHIPFNIFENFNAYQAKIFIDEYFKGDGHIRKEGCGSLYTSSKSLADQLNILTFLAGYTSKISVIDRRNNDNLYIRGIKTKCNFVSYYIEVSMRNFKNYRPTINIRNQREVVDYNGMVYCVNVKNNRIFIRRNGKSMWCGNCLQEIARHRIVSGFSGKSTRFTLKKMLREFNENYEKNKLFKVDGIDDDLILQYFKCIPHIHKIINSIFKLLKDNNMLGLSNSELKYYFPEAMFTRIHCSYNLRSFVNFYKLRSAPEALLEIQDLAKDMFEELPIEIKELLTIMLDKLN